MVEPCGPRGGEHEFFLIPDNIGLAPLPRSSLFHMSMLDQA